MEDYEKSRLHFSFFVFGVFFSGCKKKSNREAGPIAAVTLTADKEKECNDSVCVVSPKREDAVRAFFNLIDEGRVDEAVGVLSSRAVKTDEQKQSWGVKFNSIESLRIKGISAWEKKSWKENAEIYKVVAEVEIKPGKRSFDWEEGENTKWVVMVKNEEGSWEIDSIASEP